MKLVIRVFVVLFIPTALMAQDFIDVKGGRMTYTMVYQDQEEERNIRVRSFRIATTESTVGQWREFIDATGYEFTWEDHYCGDLSMLSPGENCPIQLVRLTDVVAYCNWRSENEGLTPVYYVQGKRIHRNPWADGYRLPTTAEWDFAARGGRESQGYRFAGSNNPVEVAWYGLTWEEGTRPVATKTPNELGIYDMSGNIREWTWPDGGSALPGEKTEDSTEVRGGGWGADEPTIALNNICYLYVFTWNVTGFRLARNAE